MNHLKFNLIIGLIVVEYLIAFLVSSYFLRSSITDNSVRLTEVLASRIYDDINHELSTPIGVSRTMANDLFLINRLSHESEYTQQENIEIFENYLRRIKKSFGYEAAFIVSEQSHCYYTYQGLNKIVDPINDPHDIWYSLFLKKECEHDLQIDVNEVKDNMWTAFINFRVEDAEGRLLGVCGIGQQMNNLQDLFYQIEQDHHVKVNLINSEGIVQVNTEGINISQAVLSNLSLSKKESNAFTTIVDGNDFVVTKYIEVLSWYLMIRNQEDFKFSNYTNFILYYLILFILFVITVVVTLYFVIRNVSRLERQSTEDTLTGLLNRTAYHHRLARITDERLKCLTYASIDINGLKKVNDTLGHLAGDELIAGAAQCIREYFFCKGDCYRIGGDEFAVIIRNAEKKPEQLTEEFLEVVRQWHGTRAQSLSLSIGIIRASDHDFDKIKKLIEYADMAMYKQKEVYYQSQRKA